jgi:assimilatory nitrate reductase catalytic subunit
MGWAQGFNYAHVVDIFREHAALSALDNEHSRGFNIGALQNISEADYQNFKPIFWPVTAANPQGTQRLFSDGQFFTPSRKAQLIPIHARLPHIAPTAMQVIMNTGRIRDQWHTMSRTGTAEKLMGHTDEPYIDVNPADIIKFGLEQGKLAMLENRGAVYYGRVKSTSAQREGEVFVPMHWNDKYASCSRADALVNDVVDPYCGQPEFKHSPVLIKPYLQAWNGFLISVKDMVPAAQYWAKITLANGFKFRLADTELPQDWKLWLAQQFSHIDEWAELRDSAGQFYRAVGYEQGLATVILSVATDHKTAQEVRWLEQQLGQKIAGSNRFGLLAGSPGVKVEDEGTIVCSCFQVGDKRIAKAIATGCKTAESLGEKLKCGTNCGSCIPELKAMLRQTLAAS